MGALKTDDLMDETPRTKKTKCAELAEQTPDVKAEDIEKSPWHESRVNIAQQLETC